MSEHQSLKYLIHCFLSFSQNQNPTNFVEHTSVLFVSLYNLGLSFYCLYYAFFLYVLLELVKQHRALLLDDLPLQIQSIPELLRNRVKSIEEKGQSAQRLGFLQTFLNVIGYISIVKHTEIQISGLKLFKNGCIKFQL